MWLSEREVTVRLSKSSAVIPLACVQYTYERWNVHVDTLCYSVHRMLVLQLLQYVYLIIYRTYMLLSS